MLLYDTGGTALEFSPYYDEEEATMNRRLLPASIGRYQIEVMSGHLLLYIPQELLTPTDDLDDGKWANTISVELDDDETLDLMRSLRSIRRMELESQPSFPIQADASMDELIKQLQSTYAFMRDVLLACNRFQAQGNSEEAEMILNLARKHVVGFQIVFSQERKSYVLVPDTKR